MVEVRRKRKESNSDEKVVEEKKIVKKARARLTSKLDFPVVIKYGSSSIRISPRSKMFVEDSSLLGELPTGIYVRIV